MSSHNKPDIWDTYLNTYIIDEVTVWAGPNAGLLPLETPIHIITACNPLSEKLSDKENHHRNQLLLKQLQNLNLEIKTVIGCSPKKDWQEPSFAVSGLSRSEACHLARVFNQLGIFELSLNELIVINANNLKIQGHRSRNLIN